VLDVEWQAMFQHQQQRQNSTRARLGDVIPNEMKRGALEAEIRELCPVIPACSMSRAYSINIAAKSRSVLIIQIHQICGTLMHFKVCARSEPMQ